MSREEDFLAAGVDALYAVAGGLTADTKDPDGWAFLLLAATAEKAAFEARKRMSPETYTRLRAAVASLNEHIREGAAAGTPSSVEGSRIIQEALAAGTLH